MHYYIAKTEKMYYIKREVIIMSFKEILTYVKKIACALFALILPFLGLDSIEGYGAKAPEDSETVRVMSFNVRNGEYDRGKIVPQLE